MEIGNSREFIFWVAVALAVIALVFLASSLLLRRRAVERVSLFAYFHIHRVRLLEVCFVVTAALTVSIALIYFVTLKYYPQFSWAQLLSSPGIPFVLIATIFSIWGMLNTLQILENMRDRVMSTDKLLDKLMTLIEDAREYVKILAYTPLPGLRTLGDEKLTDYDALLRKKVYKIRIEIICCPLQYLEESYYSEKKHVERTKQLIDYLKSREGKVIEISGVPSVHFVLSEREALLYVAHEVGTGIGNEVAGFPSNDGRVISFLNKTFDEYLPDGNGNKDPINDK